VQWTAGIGAVTAEALAERRGATVASARARLLAAERHGLLQRRRPLAGQPALYTVTRAGLAVSGMRGVEPCRVSAANAHHLIACASVATALERCYPDHRVLGERELRRDERECGTALASARLGLGADGSPLLHRPDLVLLASGPQPGRPVAVEVELTIKAPGRLVEICRAWARCRCVAGVLYLAPPEVERAVSRAIDKAHAAERVAVVPLDALPSFTAAREAADRRHVPAERTIAGDA
jgi:hypothetical protein